MSSLHLLLTGFDCEFPSENSIVYDIHFNTSTMDSDRDPSRSNLPVELLIEIFSYIHAQVTSETTQALTFVYIC